MTALFPVALIRVANLLLKAEPYNVLSTGQVGSSSLEEETFSSCEERDDSTEVDETDQEGVETEVSSLFEDTFP